MINIFTDKNKAKTYRKVYFLDFLGLLAYQRNLCSLWLVVMWLFAKFGKYALLNLNINRNDTGLKAGSVLLPDVILRPCTVEGLWVKI